MSTSDCCQKVWNSLKEKYTREIKKIKNTCSGSGFTEIHKWTWYDEMSFLDGYIQEKRKTSCNMASTSTDCSSLATYDMSQELVLEGEDSVDVLAMGTNEPSFEE